MGECIGMMLMQCPKPPNIVLIRKLILSPKDLDSNIWSNKNNYSSDADISFQLLEPHPFPVRSIFKTAPWGGVGNPATKTTLNQKLLLFDSIQMVNLRERYLRPGETKYL